MPLYVVFRVSEKKYKDIKQLSLYQKHMEREILVPNANMSIKNRRLIGSADIISDVQSYVEGIKLRKDGVLARDLLLTASPGFFEKASKEQKEAWVQLNIKWLKDNFGDNCTYATLHCDESTWHISALIVPRFVDMKRNRNVLANKRYFGGPDKLRNWQDNYAAAMQEVFKNLNRGIKFSKAKHVQIRQFYTMVNKELDTSELQSLCSKAKNSELLEAKVNNLQKTLNLYKNFKDKSEHEKQEIRNENEKLYENMRELHTDKDIFKESIKTLSELYKIPQNSIVQVLQYVENKLHPDKSKTVNIERSLNNNK